MIRLLCFDCVVVLVCLVVRFMGFVVLFMLALIC